MHWQFVPYEALVVIAGYLSLRQGLFGWRRRPAPGAAIFALLCGATALYSLGLLGHIGFTTLAPKVLATRLMVTGNTLLPPLWLAFVLTYVRRERWARPRYLALMSLVSAVSLLFLWWPGSNWFLGSFDLQPGSPWVLLDMHEGPWYPVYLYYGHALLGIGCVLLIRSLSWTPQSVVLLLVALGQFSAEFGENLLLAVFGWSELEPFVEAPASMVISAVAVHLGLHRYRLLDVVAIAQRVVVEGMGDGVLVLDRRGRVIDLNARAAAVLNGSRAGILGRSVAELCAEHPDLVRACGAATPVQVEIGRGGGDDRRWYDVAITPLLDGRGRPRGATLVLSDITERRLREDELRRAWQAAEADNRARSGFLAGVSHPLRTPLSAVIGYSEVLQSEAAGKRAAALGPDLQKIAAAGQKLLGVLTDILDLARAEAGKVDLYVETFPVAPLVQEVTAAVAPLAAEQGNTVTVSLPADPGSMQADRDKLRRALYNTVHNACKFTAGGQVTVAVAREQMDGAGWVRFTVTDTGRGMTPAEVAKLFVPFAHADATAHRHRGSGLSMALSQRLCQAMGGEITVTSAPGAGTAVTLRLPAAVPDTDAAPHAAAGPATVLVLDNDAGVQESIAATLVPAGYRVVGAASGREGLRLAAELSPHVILLDTMLGDMDGWAVLAALRADPDLAGVPVILLAAGQELRGGFRGGALDALAKPLDPGRLLRAVGGARRATAPG